MTNTTDTPLWYTESELAELMHVDRSTISRQVRAGSFPITPLVIGTARRLYSAAEVHRLAGLAR